MRVLMVHNRYQQAGGEDAVYKAESELLRQMGHDVITYTDDNRRISSMNRARVALDAVWSYATRAKLLKLVRDIRPEVAHFHNFFPLISPSAYSVCREAGVAVVQTLHNYRLICPAATLFRDGQVCESCIGKTSSWPAVWHGCYRSSRAQSSVVATMLLLHRWLRTWSTQVDIYIALTDVGRRKLIEGGLPAEKILVKPNFVPADPGMRHGHGGYALFVGRLSEEKGIRTLLEAWSHLEDPPLKIAGDGPLVDEVRAQIHTKRAGPAELLGRHSHDEILRLLKGALFLVFPSEWYETFGLVVIEAFASSVPVIASRLGAMAEIVEEGRTGLLFRPGDVEDLRNKVIWAKTHPEAVARMGANARRVYEETYTARENYRILESAYKTALENSTARRARSPR